jgi:hypothetical protein
VKPSGFPNGTNGSAYVNGINTSADQSNLLPGRLRITGRRVRTTSAITNSVNTETS